MRDGYDEQRRQYERVYRKRERQHQTYERRRSNDRVPSTFSWVPFYLVYLLIGLVFYGCSVSVSPWSHLSWKDLGANVIALSVAWFIGMLAVWAWRRRR